MRGDEDAPRFVETRCFDRGGCGLLRAALGQDLVRGYPCFFLSGMALATGVISSVAKNYRRLAPCRSRWVSVLFYQAGRRMGPPLVLCVAGGMFDVLESSSKARGGQDRVLSWCDRNLSWSGPEFVPLWPDFVSFGGPVSGEPVLRKQVDL